MQFIFDNLIATMVVMALTVTLLGQQARSRQESVERTSVYAAKTQALGFAEWLEDDVVKLGARFGRSRDRFKATTETREGAPFTTAFDFYYNDETVADNVVNRVEVRYELAPDPGTRVVVAKGDTPADDELLTVYRLTRSQRSGHYNTATDAWVTTGGAAPAWTVSAEYQSPPGLRHFHIEPRDSDGNPVDDSRPEDADYARVEFTVVPTLFPLHRARLVPKKGLHWATTIEIRPF